MIGGNERSKWGAEEPDSKRQCCLERMQTAPGQLFAGALAASNLYLNRTPVNRWWTLIAIQTSFGQSDPLQPDRSPDKIRDLARFGREAGYLRTSRYWDFRPYGYAPDSAPHSGSVTALSL